MHSLKSRVEINQIAFLRTWIGSASGCKNDCNGFSHARAGSWWWNKFCACFCWSPLGTCRGTSKNGTFCLRSKLFWSYSVLKITISESFALDYIFQCSNKKTNTSLVHNCVWRKVIHIDFVPVCFYAEYCFCWGWWWCHFVKFKVSLLLLQPKVMFLCVTAGDWRLWKSLQENPRDSAWSSLLLCKQPSGYWWSGIFATNFSNE